MTSQEYADYVFRLRELIERVDRKQTIAFRSNRPDRAERLIKLWERLQERLVDLS